MSNPTPAALAALDPETIIAELLRMAAWFDKRTATLATAEGAVGTFAASLQSVVCRDAAALLAAARQGEEDTAPGGDR